LTPKRKNPSLMSFLEKMVDVEINKKTGIVTHLHLISADGKQRRTFASVEVYKRWLT
jgi:hypothetical protein